MLLLRTLCAVPGSGAIFLSGVTNFMHTTLKELWLFALLPIDTFFPKLLPKREHCMPTTTVDYILTY